MKDKLTYRAKKEGYKARSVYKLKQINNKFKIIKKGDKVLDLGAWPGSWMQYCQEKGADVLGVDLVKIKGEKFLQLDVTKEEIFSKIKGEFDVVLSDLSAKTTGIKHLDEGRSVDLAFRALEIAKAFLKPKGNFVCKVFMSEEVKDLIKEIKDRFDFVKVYKPGASKKRSKEIYIIGKRKR